MSCVEVRDHKGEPEYTFPFLFELEFHYVVFQLYLLFHQDTVLLYHIRLSYPKSFHCVDAVFVYNALLVNEVLNRKLDKMIPPIQFLVFSYFFVLKTLFDTHSKVAFYLLLHLPIKQRILLKHSHLLYLHSEILLILFHSLLL